MLHKQRLRFKVPNKRLLAAQIAVVMGTGWCTWPFVFETYPANLRDLVLSVVCFLCWVLPGFYYGYQCKVDYLKLCSVFWLYVLGLWGVAVLLLAYTEILREVFLVPIILVAVFASPFWGIYYLSGYNPRSFPLVLALIPTSILMMLLTTFAAYALGNYARGFLDYSSKGSGEEEV